MSCNVTKFVLSDWDDIEARTELIPALTSAKDEAVWKEVYTNGMPFFTYRENDVIIMIYGMIYAGSGTYIPTLVASKYIKKYAKTAIKLLYDYYATYVPIKVKRLEAYCDVTDSQALRLASHFGFSAIGIRHNATVDGHDQVILERLVSLDHRKVGREQV